MVKTVLNVCYGGFGLSPQAYERLIELGMSVTTHGEDGLIDKEAWIVSYPDFPSKWDRYRFNDNILNDYLIRTDPRLIQVVEELGDEANGQCAKLKITDHSFTIRDHDGKEDIWRD